MYAKITKDGEIIKFDGGFIRNEEFVISNPSEDDLRDAGFKPLVDVSTVTETTDKRLVAKYAEEDDRIVVSYEAEEVEYDEA